MIVITNKATKKLHNNNGKLKIVQEKINALNIILN